MSALSEFLRSHGLDPFVGGVICGMILLGVLSSVWRSLKASGLSLQVNRGADRPGGAPATHGIAVNRSFKFRVKVNGVETELSNDVIESLMSALRSGNRDDAIALLQTATGMEPNAARNVIDALAKSGRL